MAVITRSIMRLFPFLLLSASLAPAQTVERWGTFEVSWEGGPHANPFRDARLTAQFTHESGRAVTAQGFYDGERTWRVRFLPTELGRWSYKTESNDPALNGKIGSLTCIRTTRPYLHGPLRAEGLHFRYADGTRPFLISTRLSCQFADPAVWKTVLAFLKEHGINRVLFMIGGVHGQFPELYGSGGEDLWSYNVEKFQAVDRFIDALRQSDILAAPYLYYFNDRHQRKLSIAQDEAYIHYVMARVSAYANVMPVLSNEVEQKNNDRTPAAYDLYAHGWANRMGAFMKTLAVSGVPVTVHNPMETRTARNPGFFTLLLDWPFQWADLQLRQMQVGALGAAAAINDNTSEPNDPVYNARAFARHNDLLIRLRRFRVPVINEEPGYEMQGTHPWNSQSALTVRQTFWTAAAAGAYAMWGSEGTYERNDPLAVLRRSQVPEFLTKLRDVMSWLPYWEMEPMNDIVEPQAETVEGETYRTNFASGKPGEAYLIYSRQGGQVVAQVPPGRYEMRALQLAPIAAAVPGAFFIQSDQTIGADGRFSIDLRLAYDWAIVLRKKQ